MIDNSTIFHRSFKQCRQILNKALHISIDYLQNQSAPIFDSHPLFFKLVWRNPTNTATCAIAEIMNEFLNSQQTRLHVPKWTSLKWFVGSSWSVPPWQKLGSGKNIISGFNFIVCTQTSNIKCFSGFRRSSPPMNMFTSCWLKIAERIASESNKSCRSQWKASPLLPSVLATGASHNLDLLRMEVGLKDDICETQKWGYIR